jgi:hypothetical protein
MSERVIHQCNKMLKYNIAKISLPICIIRSRVRKVNDSHTGGKDPQILDLGSRW